VRHNLKTLLNLMKSTEEIQGHIQYLEAVIEELREELIVAQRYRNVTRIYLIKELLGE